jgi:F0F1-type ATP synthase membrane subunit b/b'
MSRVLRSGLLALCLLGVFQILRVPVFAASPPANAAESNESPANSHELILETINFILLVGVLVYLYRKHGRAFFNERSEAIHKSLDESRQALERAQARLAEAEKKLDGLQDEVRALKERAEKEIVVEQERMRKAADDEVRRIEEFAKSRIQAATNAAKLELKDFVVEQALDQARGMIRQTMDEQNRERLVSFFLDDLSSKTKSN